MFRQSSLFQPQLWFTEITSASPHGSLMVYQPFMDIDSLRGSDRLLLHTLQTNGHWSDWLTREQTAYALGQVTSARALPSFVEFVTIATLLDSRIPLREFFDDLLVDAITDTLHKDGLKLQWKQVEAETFVCVIGAGAAACIETVSGDEKLYLRYANHIADAIAKAQNETELPRSLLGLQSNLQECIDQLLAFGRRKTLNSLTR